LSHDLQAPTPQRGLSVATSVVPLVQLTPAARLGDHDKQVSWLAALSLRITFPDLPSSGL